MKCLGRFQFRLWSMVRVGIGIAYKDGFHFRFWRNWRRVRFRRPLLGMTFRDGGGRKIAALRRCTKAQALWLQVLGAASIGGEFFTQPFELWLMNNLFLSTSWGGSGSNWGMRFAIWCWLLWKLRCSMIFDDDFSEREDLLHRGLRLIIECERVFGMTVPARVTEVRTPVRWERNGVADSLAAMGRLHGRSGVGFISPPDGVLSRLDSERTERLVEESFAALDSSRGRETGLVFDPGVSG
ncbi:hypothetical protein V6N11_020802 [Hibiscus sabdariffa]|uniref:Uncharacterized protein n=1 Tax=Hibiscus sabdariffa TaxID=183260 RepID=A0ABR2Q9Y1_9ROSI